MIGKMYSANGDYVGERSLNNNAFTSSDQRNYREISNMCSILNVVVDHTMETITPIEAEEWSFKNKKGVDDDKTEKANGQQYQDEKYSKLLVPVIRIFGPILRDPHTQPMQSACLHIHGAFPYILARPVVAGPDGSVCSNETTTVHVDWDNRQEVEKIQGEIQATLEETLQSSFLDQGFNANEDGFSRGKTNKQVGHNCPFIRRITVVVGRGFYTFCPGPSTIFLRIEYYDPKLRWKVKLSMERGLQLPRRFHPDLRRYGRTPTIDDGINDLLQFNCYEAHIPYTMQFFKDYNLAGMSYIHLRQGRIRGSLPERYYPRSEELDKNFNDQNFGNAKGNERLFLQSNTPQHFFWPRASKRNLDCTNLEVQAQPTRKNTVKIQPFMDFSSFCKLRSEYSPPSKCSSCDVEIDCSVNDIQNVDDIITSLPSDQHERDKIQWRAVPSLQEVWREERSRMESLLSSELTQEILGHSKCDGGVSDLKGGDFVRFTLDVKKNAARSGTKLATKGMWSLVNVSDSLQNEFRRSLADILERHRYSIQKVDQQLGNKNPGKVLQSMERKHQVNSGPLSEASKTKLVATSSTSVGLGTVNSEESDEVRPFIGFSQNSHTIFESVDDLHEMTRTTNEPLSYSCTQDMHESTIPTIPGEAEFSQRVDRADSILNTQDQDVDDLIDPDTLAPYDRIVFGQECCRAIFVVDTDLPNIRRICGFHAKSCPRDGHEFAATRVKPGMYRTVTSGMIVDGLMDVSNDNDYNDNDEEDYHVLEDYCRRSQKLIYREPKIQTQSIKIPDSTRLASTCLTQAIDEKPILDNFKSFDSGFLDTTLKNACESWVSKISQKNSSSDLNFGEPMETKGRYNRSLETRCKRLSNKTNLNSDEVPIRTKFKSRKEKSQTSYFEPLIRAPNIRLVKTWNRKRKGVFSSPKSESSKRKKSKNEIVSTEDVKGGRHFKRRPIIQYTDIKMKAGHGKKTEKASIIVSQDNQNKKYSRSMRLVEEENSSPTKSSQGVKSVHSLNTHGNIQSDSQESKDALDGICNQGGRLFVQGGGGLKAKTRASHAIDSSECLSRNRSTLFEKSKYFSFSPITMLSVEVHVQNRVGTSRLDSKKISMTQDSIKDKICALVYVYARDLGGGESLEILSQGCICVVLEGENLTRDSKINKQIKLQLLRAMPRACMGVQSPISIDIVKDERHLLRRFKDIVRMKDPDLMLSWDTQGAGLGYIIERGYALSKASTDPGGDPNKTESNGLDMVKLLGRTPVDKRATKVSTRFPDRCTNDVEFNQINESNGNIDQQWQGSGLGSEWDDRVGAGVAAASIVGRLVFSGWKIVAEEVKHANASYLPAVVFTVLNKRIPHHDDLLLTKWYANGPDRWRTLSHRLTQATASLLLFDALDIIGRAGEAARLSGVEFSQSFPGIRGSQYKVEGVLLRALQSLRSDERGSKEGKEIDSNFWTQQTSYSNGSGETKSQSQSPWKVRRSNAKKKESLLLDDRHYFFFSPSQEDIKEQEALEVQALTLEPKSGHFNDPVVVCDFTALYPSLIIAYNLCYSTCAGKLDYHSTRREMQMKGKTSGKIGPFNYSERRTAMVLNDHLKSLSDVSRMRNRDTTSFNFSRDRAYVAPTGTIFVSENVLKGVLPQVLDEILTTRAMLKKAAKEYKKNVKDLSPAVLRQLEARQLALKYVANVTYGYTSATFSGRCAMPLLADTIVECGRRTLQKAMHLANKWGKGIDPWGRKDNSWVGAEVIYGDTDSLFIRMPGRSKKEAFEFGERFCQVVTSMNPPPIQLKLEKVYVGSIMQTMKRYCGMKFDSKDQKRPTFEAKGLEIIRRDQCALTKKVLKNALITLFKNGIQAVKEYLFRQWSLIFAGDLPVSDFILTGKVRSKYRGGKDGPVQAVLARRLAEADPGRIIRHKERLSYVIVATPGVTFRLKDCVLTPLELLERWDAYKVHSAYYIEKHVNAALQRCFGLSPYFISIADWFGACPKPRRRTHFWPIKSKRAMITAYFGNDVCSLCNKKCQADGSSLVVVCESCQKDRIRSLQSASAMLNKIENKANEIAKKCAECNRCFESEGTFAVAIHQELNCNTGDDCGMIHPQRKSNQTLLLPLANCVCIDCPRTYERHRLREQSIESQGTYDLLINNTK